MALQDPIDLTSAEPLLRGPFIDIRTGGLTPGAHRYFDRQITHVGEIISGVNRNSVNIVQLETDYTDADSTQQAQIDINATVSTDNAGAIAILQTQVSALSAGADVDLITNPDFESGIGGWTNGIAARGDIAGSAGRLVVTNDHSNGSTSGFARAVTPITTEIGSDYTIYAEDLQGTAAVGASSNSDGSSLIDSVSGTGNQTVTFTATATTTYIVLLVNTATDAIEASAEAIYAYVAGSSQSIMSARIFESLEAIATTDLAVATNTSNISANALAISDNTGDITQNAADILTEQTARADAISAEATARQRVEARVSGVEGNLVKNAFFQEEFSGSAVPPEWTEWNNGNGTWQARVVGDGFAFSYAALGGNEGGIYQDVTVAAAKKFLISAEIRRTAGTMAGAGALVQWLNSGGTLISFDSIEFENDANLDGVVNASPDGPTRWEKEVTSPALAVTARIYAMNHFSTFGSVAVTNAMYWRECSLKPLTNAQAQTTVQAGAIADIEGATAYYDIETAASGSDPAVVSLRAGKDGSEVSLAAKILRLINNVGGTSIEVLRAVGGLAFFQNPISVDFGGRRLTIGPGHGVSSSEVVLWFGADTEAPSTQSRTNGFWSFGTDGKIYYGNAELENGDGLIGGSADKAQVVASGAPGTLVTDAVTVTPSGGTGHTYSWSVFGPNASDIAITSASSASTTFSATVTTGDAFFATAVCTITAGGKSVQVVCGVYILEGSL